MSSVQLNFIVYTVSRRSTLAGASSQPQWQKMLPFNRKKPWAGPGLYRGNPCNGLSRRTERGEQQAHEITSIVVYWLEDIDLTQINGVGGQSTTQSKDIPVSKIFGTTPKPAGRAERSIGMIWRCQLLQIWWSLTSNGLEGQSKRQKIWRHPRFHVFNTNQ